MNYFFFTENLATIGVHWVKFFPSVKLMKGSLLRVSSKWAKFQFWANYSFNICIIVGALMYSQIALERLLLNSGTQHFFDDTHTRRHRAKSPYLKGRNLHLNQWIIASVLCVCVCVFQKSQWSALQLWWAAQRNQQVSIHTLHLAHKYRRFMRGTKTYYLIFLGLSFKVWNKY